LIARSTAAADTSARAAPGHPQVTATATIQTAFRGGMAGALKGGVADN
jgi:hypothetical protein